MSHKLRRGHQSSRTEDHSTRRSLGQTQDEHKPFHSSMFASRLSRSLGVASLGRPSEPLSGCWLGPSPTARASLRFRPLGRQAQARLGDSSFCLARRCSLVRALFEKAGACTIRQRSHRLGRALPEAKGKRPISPRSSRAGRARRGAMLKGRRARRPGLPAHALGAPLHAFLTGETDSHRSFPHHGSTWQWPAAVLIF